MNSETMLSMLWSEIQFIQEQPVRNFSDGLNSLFEDFYSVFENIIDKLDEMETKIEELEGIILQQQTEIKELQGTS